MNIAFFEINLHLIYYLSKLYCSLKKGICFFFVLYTQYKITYKSVLLRTLIKLINEISSFDVFDIHKSTFILFFFNFLIESNTGFNQKLMLSTHYQVEGCFSGMGWSKGHTIEGDNWLSVVTTPTTSVRTCSLKLTPINFN